MESETIRGTMRQDTTIEKNLRCVCTQVRHKLKDTDQIKWTVLHEIRVGTATFSILK